MTRRLDVFQKYGISIRKIMQLLYMYEKYNNIYYYAERRTQRDTKIKKETHCYRMSRYRKNVEELHAHTDA